METGGKGCPRCEGLVEKIPLRSPAEYFRHLEQVNIRPKQPPPGEAHIRWFRERHGRISIRGFLVPDCFHKGTHLKNKNRKSYYYKWESKPVRIWRDIAMERQRIVNKQKIHAMRQGKIKNDIGSMMKPLPR